MDTGYYMYGFTTFNACFQFLAFYIFEYESHFCMGALFTSIFPVPRSSVAGRRLHLCIGWSAAPQEIANIVQAFCIPRSKHTPTTFISTPVLGLSVKESYRESR
jgi:hypothetical protein